MFKIYKSFDVNDLFTNWFVSKKIEDGVVIGNYENYQKLPRNKQYLMSFIQTNYGFYIRQGARFFYLYKIIKREK